MSYFPFPMEAFKSYVEAMPDDQAKGALIFLTHFMTEGFRDDQADWVRICKRCKALMGVSHACDSPSDCDD